MEANWPGAGRDAVLSASPPASTGLVVMAIIGEIHDLITLLNLNHPQR